VSTLSLFEGFGIEIEYMIVDAGTLDVRPLCDRLFTAVAGDAVDEVERGALAWSNELARHVVELKTNGPAASLDAVHELFAADVRAIGDVLKAHGARLLGTGMHPWMQPDELVLWEQGQGEIYRAYDRIFGCRGHGWANLQSQHINLPFADDAELERLHAAVRLLLPVLPALAASTPYVEGRASGWLDYRMEVYRHNSAKVPSLAGAVVPEDIASRADYEQRIFAPMYRDIAPHDPDGVLRHEWLNSRGAIVRFDRNALEIRVVDTQECPRADLAITHLVVDVLRALVDGRAAALATQRAFPTPVLASLFLDCIRRGGDAALPDGYAAAFGAPAARDARALWRALAEPRGDLEGSAAIARILEHGTLSERILRAAGRDASRQRLRDVYRALADCLDRNAQFMP
jgi:gamma-glutamyl:cysteine ligase YbdK (ATP-grasp superfamily)